MFIDTLLSKYIVNKLADQNLAIPKYEEFLKSY